MRAHVGDWLVVESRHLDEHVRRGRIVRMDHPDGTPPYVVHWTEDDRETLFFPGPETHVQPEERVQHTA
jgi:hypothetical protein